MNIKEHTTPSKLEKYSFYWSEVRLILAAVALIIGGIPLIFKILPFSSLVSSLLNLSWIVSGLASVYLLYRWNKNNKMLFGKKDKKDLITFLIMTVSGLNLGIVGILGTNIGMNISSNQIVFYIVAAVYLYSGWHLCKKRKENEGKMF